MARNERRVRSLDALVLGRGDVISSHARIAVAVGDRIAAAEAERLLGNLDARCRLPALVFGDVEHPLDLLDECKVETALRAPDDLGYPQLFLDQPLEDLVEDRVRREGILVGLIGPQLRARRLVDDRLRNDWALRPEAVAGHMRIAPGG